MIKKICPTCKKTFTVTDKQNRKIYDQEICKPGRSMLKRKA